MSESTQSSSTVGTQSASQTEAATTQSQTPNGKVDSFTQVNSMADLKEKAPEVYRKMMEGIAMKICNQMKDSQERIKEMNRESRNA
ncbi:MAG: hypothetical protein ACK4HV_03610 [Parachlamydiaceae bacterium]